MVQFPPWNVTVFCLYGLLQLQSAHGYLHSNPASNRLKIVLKIHSVDTEQCSRNFTFKPIFFLAIIDSVADKKKLRLITLCRGGVSVCKRNHVSFIHINAPACLYMFS